MMRWGGSRPDGAGRGARRDLLKKLLLASSALGLAIVAFVVYSSQFATPQTVTVRPQPATRSSTTGPAAGVDVGTLALGGGGQGARVGPGEKTKIQIFDDYGRLKAEFRSQRWEPVDNAGDEFKLTRPEVWIFTPSGQVTHIVADGGQVVVEQVGRGNLSPKWGWLRGNVRIFIDRTTKSWRERNAAFARPEQHPESVIQIWLDEVRFDVDLAQLTSEGPIQVQSHEADIQGQGLVMHWNELDDRIELLEIREGKRMLLRRTGVVSFALPGSESEVSPPAGSAAAAVTAMSQQASVAKSPTTQPQAAEKDPAAMTNLSACASVSLSHHPLMSTGRLLTLSSSIQSGATSCECARISLIMIGQPPSSQCAASRARSIPSVRRSPLRSAVALGSLSHTRAKSCRSARLTVQSWLRSPTGH